MHAWTIALLLILLPIHEDAPDYTPLVRTLACLLELTDSNQLEEAQVFHERWRKLHDAPPATDARRWPNRDYARECVGLNWSYRAWLVACQERHQSDYWRWQEYIEEADALRVVWDAVWSVGHADVYDRRTALKRLRELLGEEAYYAGRLPPHVPLWRFAETGPPLPVDLIPPTVYPPAKLRGAK